MAFNVSRVAMSRSLGPPRKAELESKQLEERIAANKGEKAFGPRPQYQPKVGDLRSDEPFNSRNHRVGSGVYKGGNRQVPIPGSGSNERRRVKRV